jgi:alkanesulfonate monooxygenase SsuD/methylene tetrahydromethanopterin reductase-like flavin-dependent oxidoreductase (luciferase family)
VFISGRTRKIAADTAADIRKQAAKFGRDPASLLIFSGVGTVVGKTDAEAQAKLADYRRYVSVEGALSLFSGYTGIDFSKYDLDVPLEYVEIDGIRTIMEGFTKADPTRRWRLREVAMQLGGGKSALVGSPTTVAEELIGFMEETGVDGFNVHYMVSPGDIVDFVELVVPELQRRGVYRTSYEEGTLREKLYGKGQRYLPDHHPGAKYRHGRSMSE